MSLKQDARKRRLLKTRHRIKTLATRPRLCIHRTLQHMYAQIISVDGSTVLVSAATVEKSLSKDLKSTGNIDAAQLIGKTVAERAKAKGIEEVAFDRAGFKYHGRVKALADAARDGGMKF